MAALSVRVGLNSNLTEALNTARRDRKLMLQQKPLLNGEAK